MNWKHLYDYSLKSGKPVWGKNGTIAAWIPDIFVSLYKDYDPVNVELSYEYNSLNMVPYKDLQPMLHEYGLNDDSLIFATCNGDPYFSNNSKIYTFMHGAENPDWELLSESVDSFFEAIINNNT